MECAYLSTNPLDIVNKCSNKKYKSDRIIYDTGFIRKLVFTIKQKKEPKILTVKMTTINDNDNNMKIALETCKNELLYSKKAADLQIGPKIYNSFYTIDKELKFFIVMEYMPMNIYEVLNSNIPILHKCKIINGVLEIIDKEFKNNLICYDIKLNNFMIDQDQNVKLIDFGGNFCQNNTKTIAKKDMRALFYFTIIAFIYTIYPNIFAFYKIQKKYDRIRKIFINHYKDILHNSKQDFIWTIKDLILENSRYDAKNILDVLVK